MAACCCPSLGVRVVGNTAPGEDVQNHAKGLAAHLRGSTAASREVSAAVPAVNAEPAMIHPSIGV